MLQRETVLESTLDLLRKLQSLPGLSGMRLVGGTALALQLGHRTSVDLDLFGQFDAATSYRKLLADAGHQADGAESGEVQSMIVDGVKVDLVNYPYKWIGDAVVEDGLTLASVDDIVAMKLSAAANRGKKKDFIDIATLLSKYTLAEMFTLYQKKFEVSEIGFAVRGLTYFQDAEEDPMPMMFTPLTWPDVKCRIIEAVKAFVVKDELTAGKDK